MSQCLRSVGQYHAERRPRRCSNQALFFFFLLRLSCSPYKVKCPVPSTPLVKMQDVVFLRHFHHFHDGTCPPSSVKELANAGSQRLKAQKVIGLESFESFDQSVRGFNDRLHVTNQRTGAEVKYSNQKNRFSTISPHLPSLSRTRLTTETSA